MSKHGNPKQLPDGRVVLTVRIPKEDFDKIWGFAQRWGISMGDVIHQLVRKRS